MRRTRATISFSLLHRATRYTGAWSWRKAARRQGSETQRTGKGKGPQHRASLAPEEAARLPSNDEQLAAAIGTAPVVLGFVAESGPVHDVCAYVSVWSQMNDFSQGIVDLRRLTLDATLVVVPLFVTVRAVDSWRWG
jgi:hypothetical protein